MNPTKSRLDYFVTSSRRHGFFATVIRGIYWRLNRIISFEICRIESSSGDPYDRFEIEGYETRSVDSDEFHNNLCAELKGVDYRWAFDRGDLCNASITNGEVVGCNFSSVLPTQVVEGVIFRFPAGFVYSYLSKTAPSHRGKRLEPDRWRVGRETRIRLTGLDPLPIWYVNVMNLEARAANRNNSARSRLLGYAGYVRFHGKFYFFNSPKCQKLGVGFFRKEGAD